MIALVFAMFWQAMPAKATCESCLNAALDYLQRATYSCWWILVLCPVCEDAYYGCLSDVYYEYEREVWICTWDECDDPGGGGGGGGWCWNDGQGGCIPPLY